MKKLLFIVNPHAGKGAFRIGFGDVMHTFHLAGYRTTLVFTSTRGDATSIAAECGGEHDRLVCMGGDGTLGETVNGIMQLPPEARPELGYIPMGTTNDSATNYGLSRDPIQAANTAAFGRVLPIDVGRCNGSYFTYVAAFGAFTEVSYETPQDQKNMFGRMAYFLDALNRLPKLTHRWMRLEYDGGVVEGDYIFCAVTNSRSVAGVIRLKDSLGISLSDGLFEIILIKTPETVMQLGPIITGILANNFTSDYVSLLRCRKARFTFREPVAWTLDGEDGGLHSEVLCENITHSIPMIVKSDI